MANEKRLIDANAFIEALENADADVCETYHDCYCDWGFSRKAIEDLLLNIPTVDAVEVVHGHWRYYSTTMQECSVCQRHTARHRFKYCPHCGATMEDRYNDG